MKKRAPAEVPFDFKRWKKTLYIECHPDLAKLEELRETIDEYTYYPFCDVLNKEIDHIIRLFKNEYFENETMEIQYRQRVLNDFYSNLFDITNFDELDYIDIGLAFKDSEYRTNTGKIISDKFYNLHPHLKDKQKMKSIVSRIVNHEIFLMGGMTQLAKEKGRGRSIGRGKQLKEGNNKLTIYKSIVDRLRNNKRLTVRGACSNIFDKSPGNIVGKSIDNFYKSFLSFYQDNKEKYPSERNLIQNRKQK